MMHIGAARVTLFLPESMSLKEKRGVVKSIVDRSRHRFNAAISEVEDLNDLRVATIGITVVSNDSRHADEMLQVIVGFIEREADADLGEVETEILTF
jgi:uncharacterized protein YlxP (DUF503 family)